LFILHPDSIQVEFYCLLGDLVNKNTPKSKGKQANFLQEEILHIRYHSDDWIMRVKAGQSAGKYRFRISSTRAWRQPVLKKWYARFWHDGDS